MRPWSRTVPAEYHRLRLRAHALLADVPLLDVWRVDLPGGGPSRTMLDVRAALTRVERTRRLSAVRALFALRWFLGSVFRWDTRPSSADAVSFRSRLTKEDRRRSLVEPGTKDGPFEVLYVHEHEAVSEIHNATVHAFLVSALEPTAGGYRLFWAIHVLPVSVWTRPYMALIGPFRRWLVYPSLLRSLHAAWRASLDSDR